MILLLDPNLPVLHSPRDFDRGYGDDSASGNLGDSFLGLLKDRLGRLDGPFRCSHVQHSRRPVEPRTFLVGDHSLQSLKVVRPVSLRSLFGRANGTNGAHQRLPPRPFTSHGTGPGLLKTRTGTHLLLNREGWIHSFPSCRWLRSGVSVNPSGRHPANAARLSAGTINSATSHGSKRS